MLKMYTEQAFSVQYISMKSVIKIKTKFLDTKWDQNLGSRETEGERGTDTERTLK